MARRIHFTRMISKAQDIATSIESLQFSQFHLHSATWTPAVNVYRYENAFEVCVDLAGVVKDAIQIHVEPLLLRIEGERISPRPACGSPGDACRQTLALEIENGPFKRTITFPSPINPEAVQARQENGFLWISLPFHRVKKQRP